MLEEEWKDIPEFPNYMISNTGRVWNNYLDKEMRITPNNHGNMRIGFRIGDGIKYTRSVAMLVAQNFLPPPPDELCDFLMLLDGDKTNVRVTNLVWRPAWMVQVYSRQFRIQQPNHYYNLLVRNISTGKIYHNIIEAGMTEGLLFRDIWSSTYTGRPLYPHYHVFEII